MIIPRFKKNKNKGFDEALQSLIENYSTECLSSTILYDNHYKFNSINVQFGYKADKTSDTIRIEFNPNKDDLTVLIPIFSILKKHQFPFIYFSRIDIAVDYFEFLDARFFTDCKKSQSHSYTRKGNGIETIYFGSSQSEVQIRVYNKLTEMLKKTINQGKKEKLTINDYDTPVWRVEAQIRSDLFRNSVLKNPFGSLDIYDRFDHVNDWQAKSFSAWVERDGIEACFSEMPSQTRKRWRKKLDEFKTKNMYHPKDIFNDHSDKLLNNIWDHLEKLFNFSHNQLGLVTPDIITQNKL